LKKIGVGVTIISINHNHHTLREQIYKKQLVLTLDSGYHMATIQEFQLTQTLKTISLRSTTFILKMYIKYTKVKSITKTGLWTYKNNNCFVFLLIKKNNSYKNFIG